LRRQADLSFDIVVAGAGIADPPKDLVTPGRLELEAICGRERSGSPQPKS
jgi:hypothetical protein